MNWNYECDGHFSRAKNGRYLIVAWPFGANFQSTVTIDTPGVNFLEIARIGLAMCPTLEKAKKQAENWVEWYEKRGPFYPDEIIQPRLEIESREKILGHIFLCSGNGYAWVDGAIIDEEQDYEMLNNLRNDIKIQQNKLEKIEQEICSITDGNFQYHINNKEIHSITYKGLLFDIPPNINTEWQEIILEVAQILKNKGYDEVDREFGKWLVQH